MINEAGNELHTITVQFQKTVHYLKGRKAAAQIGVQKRNPSGVGAQIDIQPLLWH